MSSSIRKRTKHPRPKLSFDPFQPRKTFAAGCIDRLVASAGEAGFYNPIHVRPAPEDNFWIMAGQCRVLAGDRLGITEWDCIEHHGLTDGQALEFAIRENEERTAIDDVDLALAVDRLMTMEKINAAEASKRLVFSESRVSRLRALLKLPQRFQELVRQGLISLSHANELAGIADPEVLERLAALSASGKISRDQIKKEVSAATGKERRVKSGRIAVKLSDIVTVSLGLGQGAVDVRTIIESFKPLLAALRKAGEQPPDDLIGFIRSNV